eukprot:23883_4
MCIASGILKVVICRVPVDAWHFQEFVQGGTYSQDVFQISRSGAFFQWLNKVGIVSREKESRQWERARITRQNLRFLKITS